MLSIGNLCGFLVRLFGHNAFEIGVDEHVLRVYSDQQGRLPIKWTGEHRNSSHVSQTIKQSMGKAKIVIVNCDILGAIMMQKQTSKSTTIQTSKCSYLIVPTQVLTIYTTSSTHMTPPFILP